MSTHGTYPEYTQEAITLLSDLIRIRSFSGEEHETAARIHSWFQDKGIPARRSGNNVWCQNQYYDKAKPTLLLNSHHDTVKPNQAYTRNPYDPATEDGRLYGLGSNDAGGPLVTLIAVFTHLYARPDLTYNLVFAATAEEENSGPNGLNALLTELPHIDLAIVGEPTGMHMAIAEKGLLVIDGTATGTPGHAAHENADNAVYKALDDINWIRNFSFPKISDFLGPVKMTVTQIAAGEQHNVIPATCTFVIDVRVNEHYTNEEIFAMIDQHTQSQLKARSFRLNSSGIDPEHALVKAGIALGREIYGSPTLSDQAVLSCPSLKLGPGDSKRSHQADEFIYTREIEEGISLYIQLLESFLLS